MSRSVLQLTVLSSVVLSVVTGLEFGTIRWDAWNQFPNGSYDDVSKWNQMDVSVKEWQGRLPFFGKIDANGSAVFNEDDQDVMDQEILYATKAGLSYFAFDTYCQYPRDVDIPQCEFYFNSYASYMPSKPAYALDRFLASKHRSSMKFTLMTLSAAASHPRFVDWYVKELFPQPEFLRVNGRPVLFLFQISDKAAQQWGGWPQWKATWDALRNASIVAGQGNPYLIACANSQVTEAETFRQQLGFDAVGSYALPGGTTAGSPFSDMVAAHSTFLQTVEANGLNAVIPAATGWDARPRAGRDPWVHENAMHYIPPTGAELKALVNSTAQWICQHPDLAKTQLALMYAWNENTENGAPLIPTLGQGTTFVDALSEILPGLKC